MLEDDPYVRLLLGQWVNGGGSALPAVRRLIDNGLIDEAAATARVALRIEDMRAGKPIGVAAFERHLDGDGAIAAQRHARRR